MDYHFSFGLKVHATAKRNKQFLPSGRKCIVKVKGKAGDKIKVICPRSHGWRAELSCGFVRCSVLTQLGMDTRKNLRNGGLVE